ncbi:MAG: AEC family transporter [Erysipelotrichia bacterium]|nr:AEC family transporter [Erysipelotrichia bacterium]NCC55281.1 AEC family transporter [Erysipelotrichia bacterium]
MVDFNNLINLQIELFIFMSLGFILNKLKIIPASVRKGITDLVIYVVLPCNIVYSFMIEMNMDIVYSGIVILIVSLLIQLVCEIMSHFIYPFANEQQQKVLKYATICSNAGFMGSPLIQGLYGLQGLLFASLYLIPQRIVMWSSGIACFSSAKGKEVIYKVISHPCIIAVFVGMLVMILPIELPVFISKSLAGISDCTMFLSMIVIGGILAEINISSVFNKVSLYFSIIRLLFIPLLVLLGCYLCHLPVLVSSVATVLAGMPAGTTTAILAEKYHGDAPLAVRLIFLSTILSLFTIPILCMIIESIM